MPRVINISYEFSAMMNFRTTTNSLYRCTAQTVTGWLAVHFCPFAVYFSFYFSSQMRGSGSLA